MKLRGYIHRRIINAGAEEFFVALRRLSGFVRRLVPIRFRHRFTSFGRLIPDSASYPPDDRHFVMRDRTQFVVNRSDYVQWRLFYGVRDNALQAAKSYLTPGSVVLDIGANSGAFSLRLANYAIEKKYEDVQIHVFEPNPLALENYRANLELNPGLERIVQLHPIALGNESSDRPFRYDAHHTGAGRVMGHEGQGQFQVEVRRLDDVITAINPGKVAFVKLIAGGFEPIILKGGWDMFKQHKPPIFLEVTAQWWSENDSTVDETLDRLRSLGYRFMIEQHNEMVPFDENKNRLRTQFNLLATAASTAAP